jgi:hypothetical protein
MKLVVVISPVGDCGKTVLATHVLTPLVDATLIAIGTAKNGERHDHTFRIKEMNGLAGELMVSGGKNFVLDVQASCAKQFVENCGVLSSFRGSVGCWVVPFGLPYQRPVVTRTVDSLMRIGVNPKNIALVANNVTGELEGSELQLFMNARSVGMSVPDEPIYASEAIRMLDSDERSIFDVVNAKVDFERQRRDLLKVGDKKNLLKLGREIVLFDLSVHAVKNARNVFEQLSPLQ